MSAFNTETIHMLYPKEGSYQWFFNEIANRQSRADELLYHLPFREKDPNRLESAERMEREATDLVRRAHNELANDEVNRLATMLMNTRKGS